MIVRRFLADTHGAAGIAAALLSMVFLGGAALIVDHLWLVGQRDVMKNAADAATIAATMESEKYPDAQDDNDTWAQVETVARRYALLNILGNVPASEQSGVRDSLVVEVADHAAGTVEVTLDADLGGTLLADPLLNYAGPESIKQRSGVQPTITPTELVLAIDVTASMRRSIIASDGFLPRGHRDTRMEIVKRAALDLLDALEAAGAGETAPFAVGVVPWHYRVRLNETARASWEANGWATYPEHRLYPHPPPGRGPASPAHPELQILPVRSAIPASCRAWAGCPDSRAVNVATTVLPANAPFAMGFFPRDMGYPLSGSSSRYVSFRCQGYSGRDARANGWQSPSCYDWSATQLKGGCTAVQARNSPQRLHLQNQCENDLAILPLTANTDAARVLLQSLNPIGSQTNSTLGIEWAHRLLAPSWRTVWGDPVHPMESTQREALKKVIVLLTDGEDNRPENGATANRHRACTAAKQAGIQMFTIAAMDAGNARLAADLRRCSSQDDDPAGTYAFVNNATPENLAQAFREVGRQLLTLRRTL